MRAKVRLTRSAREQDVPTTLNGCPLSIMLNPFLMSAVVAVAARTYIQLRKGLARKMTSFLAAFGKRT